MLHRFRDRFGTAGLIIAVVALIAALAGTAFAASGLNSKQKKEVKSIAKNISGKPGPAGQAGANGAKGDKGDTGSAGNNGTNGADGKSVEVEAAGGKCPNGGSIFKVGGVEKGKACNGEDGETGFTEVLPKGKTETGTWGSQQNEGFFIESISFPIPLAAAPTPVFVGKSTEAKTKGAEEGCPGPDGNGLPTAEEGKLCVYHLSETGTIGTEPAEIGFFDPRGQFGSAFGAAPSGTVLGLTCKATPCLEYGTWAVTPES